MSGQWPVQSLDGDQWFVYVLKDVGVITWPAAHETEKQTQAVYIMGHCQGYRREDVCLYNVSKRKCKCGSLEFTIKTSNFI